MLFNQAPRKGKLTESLVTKHEQNKPLKNNGLFQARVVQRMENAVHRINLYSVESVVCFVNTYPLDRDLLLYLLDDFEAFEQQPCL